MERIYYQKPSITDLEIRYVADAVTNGWGEECYRSISLFEQLFRTHLGVDYAIATSSCTGALHLGMAGLGIQPGDEVVLADINWCATVAPIMYLGATPVFVDILRDSWCIDPDAAEAAITRKTKAIIATHLYGNVCEMERLLKIGEKHNLIVVEDAAEAVGSEYFGKKVGSIGKFGTFSFHGTKTITTGEGGMFVTNDPALYERVLTLSNHGRSRHEHRQFWVERIGYKYKMANVQAAIGCAQMERLQQILGAKRRVFEYYVERLKGLPLRLNLDTKERRNGCWLPTLVLDDSAPCDRDAILHRFSERHIDGRVFFWPLSMMAPFESKPSNTVSYSIHSRGLNLPSYCDLTEPEMDRVCATVNECVTDRL